MAALGLGEIRAAVSELGKEYGAEHIYLFGSYARGDARAGSDIDLRIDKGNIRGLFALAGLQLALEDRLGCKVDLLCSDSLDSDFISNIGREEVLLYAAE